MPLTLATKGVWEMKARTAYPVFLISLLFSIWLALVCAQADATATFSRSDYAVGDLPTGVAAGDFNGDGRTDIAVANGNEYNVTVLLCEGARVFGGGADYAVDDLPTAVVAGDVDCDGRLDLAVGTANGVSVLYGQAAGGFRKGEYCRTGFSSRAIALADFNGDGKLDCAVTSYRVVAPGVEGAVSILYWQPSGGFGSRADYPVGTRPEGIAAADFNNNGIPDIAVANSASDSVSVLYGQPSGGLGTRTDFAVGYMPMGITAADYDGDGRIDLAVTNREDGDVSLLYGHPTAGFCGRVDYDAVLRLGAITTADCNGDGLLDLCVAQEGSAVTMLYGQVGGGFGGRIDYEVSTAPSGVVAGDFDKDGRTDLAIANQSDDSVAVLYYKGAGLEVTHTYPTGIYTRGIVAADFNSDGRPEVAALDYNAVRTFFGQPDGTFISSTYPYSEDGYCIATGDFNGDAKPDAVVGKRGTVTVYYPDSSGRFSTIADYDGPYSDSIAVGDFNRDARPDLALGSSVDNRVSILYAQPGGGFGGKVDYPVGVEPLGAAVGDFNRDTLLDVAVANATDSTVTVYYGQPGGALGGKKDYAVGWRPSAIAAADLDGDSRLDLAIANENDRDVTVLFGLATGDFGRRADYAVAGFPCGLAAADIDGDGKFDIVVTNTGSWSVSALYGIGGGAFGDRTDFALQQYPWAVAAGDFDGDGRIDLAVTDDQAGYVQMLMAARMPITIATATVPDGIVNCDYAAALIARGGTPPYEWSLASGSLPQGLVVDPSGAIKGIPRLPAGTSEFTVRATDSQNRPAIAECRLAITTTVDVQDFLIVGEDLPPAQEGLPYFQILTAGGGNVPYTWSLKAGSLPAGLVLSTGGVISGTATVHGTSYFTVTATDAGTPPHTASQAYSIAVGPDINDPVITTSDVPSGTVDAAYCQLLLAAGGTTPYGWSIVSGSLPAGLTLNTVSGVISGAPTGPGTSSFRVRVTDSHAPAATDERALSITVAASGQIYGLSLTPSHILDSSEALWPNKATKPTFSWIDGTGIMKRFWMEVSTDSSMPRIPGRTIVLGGSGITAAPYTVTGAQWKRLRHLATKGAGVLYWRVRGKSGGGRQVCISAVKTLIVDGGRWEVSELDLDSTSPTVTWSHEGEGIVRYRLQFSSDVAFRPKPAKTVKVPAVSITGTSHTLSPAAVKRLKVLAARNGVDCLYYRVRGQDADGAFKTYSPFKTVTVP